jgi:CRP/FNR family transcriptional regulator, cyclic AMP receptor protein
MELQAMTSAKKLPEVTPTLAVVVDNQEILSKVSLFADIKDNPEAFSVLYKLMTLHIYKAGETIIKEGDTGTDFYILADGAASVFKKTQDGDLYKVAILAGHMGAFFGESGLLEADTRTATIRAETECRCLVLTRTDFENYCNANPQWALPILKRVAKAIMGRLKNMNHDLGLLYKALVDEFAQR